MMCPGPLAGSGKRGTHTTTSTDDEGDNKDDDEDDVDTTTVVDSGVELFEAAPSTCFVPGNPEPE